MAQTMGIWALSLLPMSLLIASLSGQEMPQVTVAQVAAESNPENTPQTVYLSAEEFKEYFTALQTRLETDSQFQPRFYVAALRQHTLECLQDSVQHSSPPSPLAEYNVIATGGLTENLAKVEAKIFAKKCGKATPHPYVDLLITLYRKAAFPEGKPATPEALALQSAVREQLRQFILEEGPPVGATLEARVMSFRQTTFRALNALGDSPADGSPLAVDELLTLAHRSPHLIQAILLEMTPAQREKATLSVLALLKETGLEHALLNNPTRPIGFKKGWVNQMPAIFYFLRAVCLAEGPEALGRHIDTSELARLDYQALLDKYSRIYLQAVAGHQEPAATEAFEQFKLLFGLEINMRNHQTLGEDKSAGGDVLIRGYKDGTVIFRASQQAPEALKALLNVVFEQESLPPHLLEYVALIMDQHSQKDIAHQIQYVSALNKTLRQYLAALQHHDEVTARQKEQQFAQRLGLANYILPKGSFFASAKGLAPTIQEWDKLFQAIFEEANRQCHAGHVPVGIVQLLTQSNQPALGNDQLFGLKLIDHADPNMIAGRLMDLLESHSQWIKKQEKPTREQLNEWLGQFTESLLFLNIASWVKPESRISQSGEPPMLEFAATAIDKNPISSRLGAIAEDMVLQLYRLSLTDPEYSRYLKIYLARLNVVSRTQNGMGNLAPMIAAEKCLIQQLVDSPSEATLKTCTETIQQLFVGAGPNGESANTFLIVQAAKPQLEALLQKTATLFYSDKPQERQLATNLIAQLPRLVPSVYHHHMIPEGMATLNDAEQNIHLAIVLPFEKIFDAVTGDPRWQQVESSAELSRRMAFVTHLYGIRAKLATAETEDIARMSAVPGSNVFQRLFPSFQSRTLRASAQTDTEKLLEAALPLLAQQDLTHPAIRQNHIAILDRLVNMFPNVLSDSTHTILQVFLPPEQRLALLQPELERYLEALRMCPPNTMTTEEVAAIASVLRWGGGSVQNTYVDILETRLYPPAGEDPPTVAVTAALYESMGMLFSTTRLYQLLARASHQLDAPIQQGIGQVISRQFLGEWLAMMPQAQVETLTRMEAAIQRRNTRSSTDFTPTQQFIVNQFSLYRGKGTAPGLHDRNLDMDIDVWISLRDGDPLMRRLFEIPADQWCIQIWPQDVTVEMVQTLQADIAKTRLQLNESHKIRDDVTRRATLTEAQDRLAELGRQRDGVMKKVVPILIAQLPDRYFEKAPGGISRQKIQEAFTQVLGPSKWNQTSALETFSQWTPFFKEAVVTDLMQCRSAARQRILPLLTSIHLAQTAELLKKDIRPEHQVLGKLLASSWGLSEDVSVQWNTFVNARLNQEISTDPADVVSQLITEFKMPKYSDRLDEMYLDSLRSVFLGKSLRHMGALDPVSSPESIWVTALLPHVAETLTPTDYIDVLAARLHLSDAQFGKRSNESKALLSEAADYYKARGARGFQPGPDKQKKKTEERQKAENHWKSEFFNAFLTSTALERNLVERIQALRSWNMDMEAQLFVPRLASQF